MQHKKHTNWANNLALELRDKIAIARLNKHQLINQGNKMSSITYFADFPNSIYDSEVYTTESGKDRAIKLVHERMKRLLDQHENLDSLRYVIVDFDNATSTVYELSIERTVKYELTGY